MTASETRGADLHSSSCLQEVRRCFRPAPERPSTTSWRNPKKIGKHESAIRELVSPLAGFLKSFIDHRHRLETTGQQTHTSLELHRTLLAGTGKQFQRKPPTW